MKFAFQVERGCAGSFVQVQLDPKGQIIYWTGELTKVIRNDRVGWLSWLWFIRLITEWRKAEKLPQWVVLPSPITPVFPPHFPPWNYRFSGVGEWGGRSLIGAIITPRPKIHLMTDIRATGRQKSFKEKEEFEGKTQLPQTIITEDEHEERIKETNISPPPHAYTAKKIKV